MKLKIVHLFPELMSLYGEYANVEVLRRHLQLLDVSVDIVKAHCGDNLDFSQADVVYMGAGTENNQKYALELLSPSGNALRDAASRGVLLLFTGNAMETLGSSITDANGKVWPGLALAGFSSIETNKRITGDVIAKTTLWDTPVVGFMNKCSTTSGVSTPLFSELTLGFGNDRDLGAEGFVSGNTFATHITGPILVKNPDFTGLLIRHIFAQKNWDAPVTLPVLPYEREAYSVTLNELNARA